MPRKSNLRGGMEQKFITAFKSYVETFETTSIGLWHANNPLAKIYSGEFSRDSAERNIYEFLMAKTDNIDKRKLGEPVLGQQNPEGLIPALKLLHFSINGVYSLTELYNEFAPWFPKLKAPTLETNFIKYRTYVIKTLLDYIVYVLEKKEERSQLTNEMDRERPTRNPPKEFKPPLPKKGGKLRGGLNKQVFLQGMLEYPWTGKEVSKSIDEWRATSRRRKENPKPDDGMTVDKNNREALEHVLNLMKKFIDNGVYGDEFDRSLMYKGVNLYDHIIKVINIIERKRGTMDEDEFYNLLDWRTFLMLFNYITTTAFDDEPVTRWNQITMGEDVWYESVDNPTAQGVWDLPPGGEIVGRETRQPDPPAPAPAPAPAEIQGEIERSIESQIQSLPPEPRKLFKRFKKLFNDIPLGTFEESGKIDIFQFYMVQVRKAIYDVFGAEMLANMENNSPAYNNLTVLMSTIRDLKGLERIISKKFPAKFETINNNPNIDKRLKASLYLLLIEDELIKDLIRVFQGPAGRGKPKKGGKLRGGISVDQFIQLENKFKEDIKRNRNNKDKVLKQFSKFLYDVLENLDQTQEKHRGRLETIVEKLMTNAGLSFELNITQLVPRPLYDTFYDTLFPEQSVLPTEPLGKPTKQPPKEFKPPPPKKGGKLKGKAMPEGLIPLQQMAKEAYNLVNPKKEINGWELKKWTPTLKFYGKGNEIIIAVRGTKANAPDGNLDITADLTIPFNGIPRSARYTLDKAMIENFQKDYPQSQYAYFAVGHSLGGAIIDSLIRDRLIREAVSYNPAIQFSDINRGLPNRRIYYGSDPLYRLMGWWDVKSEHREPENRTWADFLSGVSLPAAAIAALPAHNLSNFEGGKKKQVVFA